MPFQITPEKAAEEIKRWLIEQEQWMDSDFFRTAEEHREAGHEPLEDAFLVLFVDGSYGAQFQGRKTCDDFLRMVSTLGLEAVDSGSWWYFFRRD